MPDQMPDQASCRACGGALPTSGAACPCQGDHDRAFYLPVPLGRIHATPGALTALGAPGLWNWSRTPGGVSAATLLCRHEAGDWGILSAADVAANDAALRDDDRLLSAYLLPDGGKVWIITEADRSQTTILLPEEY